MAPPRFDTPVRSILFVCLGNICRSPLAEGVFRHLARERGVEERIRIDSAGTGGWHVGDPPDRRATQVAREHGIALESRARQLHPGDAEAFDLVLAMDRSNLQEVKRVFGSEGGTRVRLFRDFDPDGGAGEAGGAEVPDPYYGGPDGFLEVHYMVTRTCQALLDQVVADLDG